MTTPRTVAIEAFLLLRGMLFLGRRFRCPVCRWSIRHFVRGGGSFRARPGGYCPRCNSKGRHRRVWLYLQQETDLLGGPIRLLHVSPHYSLARRLSAMPAIDYVGAGLDEEPHVTVRADLAALPFDDASFDAAICVHVLEHVERDREAIAELYRVLRPGGWALVNVPVRMEAETYEDAAITSAKERRAAFGEDTHVRVYGRDLTERLAGAGFDVRVSAGEDVPPGSVERHGLPTDERIFFCRRATVGVA